MTDIKDREDIAKLVEAFYTIAIENETIGYIFTDVAKLNLEKHIPTICDFWETVLFGNMVYKGSVVSKHIELHKLSELKEIHFDTWLGIWKKTVHRMFSGAKADETIQRAEMMAVMMKHKINHYNKGGFIQ